MGIQAEEAEKVLESVGFNAEMRQKAIASLSGGWKMKLALGATTIRCEVFGTYVMILTRRTSR